MRMSWRFPLGARTHPSTCTLGGALLIAAASGCPAAPLPLCGVVVLACAQEDGIAIIDLLLAEGFDPNFQVCSRQCPRRLRAFLLLLTSFSSPPSPPPHCLCPPSCAHHPQREPDYFTPLHLAIAAWKPAVAIHLITSCKADVHAVAGVRFPV